MRNTRRLWSVSSLVIVVSALACGHSRSLPVCYGDVVRGPCRYVPTPEPLVIVDGRPWKKGSPDIDPAAVDTMIALDAPEAMAHMARRGETERFSSCSSTDPRAQCIGRSATRQRRRRAGAPANPHKRDGLRPKYLSLCCLSGRNRASAPGSGAVLTGKCREIARPMSGLCDAVATDPASLVARIIVGLNQGWPEDRGVWV